MSKLWTQHNTNPIACVRNCHRVITKWHKSLHGEGRDNSSSHACDDGIIKNMMRVYVQQEQNTILRVRTKQNTVMTRWNKTLYVFWPSLPYRVRDNDDAPTVDQFQHLNNSEIVKHRCCCTCCCCFCSEGYPVSRARVLNYFNALSCNHRHHYNHIIRLAAAAWFMIVDVGKLAGPLLLLLLCHFLNEQQQQQYSA